MLFKPRVWNENTISMDFKACWFDNSIEVWQGKFDLKMEFRNLNLDEHALQMKNFNSEKNVR